jgi:threonine dehydratase
MNQPPTIGDVRVAAARLSGRILRTPLLTSPELDEHAGSRVLIKAESLQKTGSFKFRGAMNKLLCIDQNSANGVVAFSSGNHGQAVAAAARELGMPAVIVMPVDAPRIKVEKTAEYGADIRFYDRRRDDRVAMASKIAVERNATLVPSFDDPYVIAGQGTLVLETLEQAAHFGVPPRVLIAPCGGGGLIAGCGLAFLEAVPSGSVYSVEPAGFDDTARSLVTGIRQRNVPDAHSICDALLIDQPGALTWPINQQNLSGGVVVTDSEVQAAMGFAFRALKLVVEPSGAVALAAVLQRKIKLTGTAVIVCTGGNVDPDTYARAIV